MFPKVTTKILAAVFTKKWPNQISPKNQKYASAIFERKNCSQDLQHQPNLVTVVMTMIALGKP